jgi:DNA-directed RNA polymerase specialized sigma24 family protein
VRELLAMCRAELTERQWDALWLRHAEGMSWPEVAAKFGVAEHTAYLAEKVAREKLDKRLYQRTGKRLHQLAKEYV